MSLDITALARLERTTETDPGAIRVIDNTNFPGRFGGLDRAYYRGEKVLSFAAGSYTNYGDWRDLLAKMAGYDPIVGVRHPYAESAWSKTEGPFWELINFADNEGTIGPVVCAKLANDFSAWHSRAEVFAQRLNAETPDQTGSWFLEKFCAWQRAFELASDRGCVDFH